MSSRFRLVRLLTSVGQSRRARCRHGSCNGCPDTKKGDSSRRSEGGHAVVAIASRSDPEHATPCTHRRRSDELVRDGRPAATREWVIEQGRTMIAVLVLLPGWIDQIYVDPEHTGRALGTRLVELVKELNPAGLDLWTFESNTWAASLLRAPRLRCGRCDRRRQRGGCAGCAIPLARSLNSIVPPSHRLPVAFGSVSAARPSHDTEHPHQRPTTRKERHVVAPATMWSLSADVVDAER